MYGLRLFVVCCLARVLILTSRPVSLSPGGIVASFWQDALAAIALGALLGVLPRLPWGGKAAAALVYGLASTLVALNVGVVRVLGSPISWPMLRAARGTLGDSITHHLTPGALLPPAAVLVVAAGAAVLLRHTPRRSVVVLSLFLGAGLAAVGAGLARTVDLSGLDRNPLETLPLTLAPRLGAESRVGRWHVSPLGAAPEEAPRSPGLAPLSGKARGRNILLVLLESTGARHLKMHGATQDPTPWLTRQASESLVFEAAYSVYPESIKGLFSVLTSTAPALDTPVETHGRAQPPALAEVLRTQGYRTALFHSGRFMYLGMETIVQGRGFETLEDAGDIGGEKDSSFGIDEPSAVQRILRWIDGGPRERPFFVVYLPIAGHHPYNSPGGGPFPGAEERGRYLNALHYGDRSLEVLHAGLVERGLAEQTLLVLCGDHGEAFGEHAGNFGHTFFLYEENLHVPLLVLAPGLTTHQVRVRSVASLLDLGPTILDLVGLDRPPDWQGESLLSGSERMALFLTDYSAALLGLRDGPWKAVHEVESGKTKLFHLGNDPGEKNDLAQALPARAGAYRAHLLAWASAQRAHVAGLAAGARSPAVLPR